MIVSYHQTVFRIPNVFPVSRMFNADSVILIYIHSKSQISDPGSNNNKRGVEILLSFLCSSQKFKKIVNYFNFEQVRYRKKLIYCNWQRIKVRFTQNIAVRSQKYGLGDPGSEIQDPEKTYPGSRGQKSPRSGSATLLSEQPRQQYSTMTNSNNFEIIIKRSEETSELRS
jgi:hypothetical protein